MGLLNCPPRRGKFAGWGNREDCRVQPVHELKNGVFCQSTIEDSQFVYGAVAVRVKRLSFERADSDWVVIGNQLYFLLAIRVFDGFQFPVNIEDWSSGLRFHNSDIVMPLSIIRSVYALKPAFIPKVKHVVKNLVQS